MNTPRYRRSRFDTGDEDPMGPLANLADIMLVFAVGLMVALAASQRSGQLVPEPSSVHGARDVSEGRELPDVPTGMGASGAGYEAMGQVYRDRETGRLILMSPE